MPFEIAETDALLLNRLYGTLTRADLIGLAERTQQMEDASPVAKDRIIDVRDVEQIEITFADMDALAEMRRSRTFARPVKSAVIVKGPLQMGYARMFQTVNDNPYIVTRIFHSVQDAMNWFAEQR